MKTVQQLLDIPRDKARELGFQTLEILNQGWYRDSSGEVINIRNEINHSAEKAITYAPGNELPENYEGNFQTKFFVENVTTLSAAKHLVDKGHNPAVLNMASATSPGGGWLNGARAQEEYLARSSALYAAIKGSPMYKQTDFHTNPFYDDFVIYSPDVIVFRDDEGNFLDKHYSCSFLTSPAIQAAAVHKYMPGRVSEISGVMLKRIRRLLAVAAKHNHTTLVLGAWGCGAFGNDGNMIAGLFKQAFHENFKGAFERVCFAITDWSPEKRYIKPFQILVE